MLHTRINAHSDMSSTHLSTSSSLFSASVPPPPPPAPPPPPPPPPIPSTPSLTQSMSGQSSSRPRSRLRQLPWTTIPASRVNGRRCFWTEVCGKHGSGSGSVSAPSTPQFRRRNTTKASDDVEEGKEDEDRIPEMNFEQMERLFAIDAERSSNGRTGRQELANNSEIIDRKKHSDEINLLDAKRSLTVNIFLRQFHSTTASAQHPQPSPADQVIRQLLLKHSDSRTNATEQDAVAPVPDTSSSSSESSTTMQVDTLRSLLKIFPEDDELKLLRSYKGDRNRLGQAERFLVELTELTECKLRIECVLVKAEFMTTMDSIRPVIDAVMLTVRDIKENEMLHSIIYIILIVGNYLNAGGYSGEAVGFRIGSLLKLTEIRANKPNMNLLHYVAMQAEAKDPELLQLPHQFAYIKEAALYSTDTTHSDISLLSDKIRSISQNIQRSSDDRLKRQFAGFIEAANDELQDLERDLAHIESLRRHLADYFCEDESTFKLDDCITTFSVFLESFRKAVEENEQRRQQAEKAEERRRQREDQILTRQLVVNSRSDTTCARTMRSGSISGQQNGCCGAEETRRRRHSVDITTSMDAANEDLVMFLCQSQRLASATGDRVQANTTTTEEADVVDPTGMGSLSRRRSFRRSRRLTPEVLHTEREWTGSPATTLSTTPSPRPFTSGGSPMLVSSNTEPWTANGGGKRASSTKRLLPVHPEQNPDVDIASRRCHSSMSTFVENRYFVPISTGNVADDDAKAALPPRQTFDQRRAKSSLSSRRLPSITDSAFQSGAEANPTVAFVSSDNNEESAEHWSSGSRVETKSPVAPPRRPRSSLLQSHEAIIEEKDYFRKGNLENVYQNLLFKTERMADGVSSDTETPNSSCATPNHVSDPNAQSTESQQQTVERGRSRTVFADFDSTDRPSDSNEAFAILGESVDSNCLKSTASSVKRGGDTLKNRFRRLSMLYQNNAVEDLKQPFASMSSRVDTARDDSFPVLSSTNKWGDDHRIATIKTEPEVGKQTVIVAPDSDDARAIYEDTDSTSSGGRDEGFESETPLVGDVHIIRGKIASNDSDRLSSTSGAKNGFQDSATDSVHKKFIGNVPPENHRGMSSSRKIQKDEEKPQTRNSPAGRMISGLAADVTTRSSRSATMKSSTHTVKTATLHLSTASRPQLSNTTAAARPSTQYQRTNTPFQPSTASNTISTTSVSMGRPQSTAFQRNTPARSTMPMMGPRRRSSSLAVTHRVSVDEGNSAAARQTEISSSRRHTDLNRKENDITNRLVDECRPVSAGVRASTLSRPTTAARVDSQTRHRPTSSTGARVFSTPIRYAQPVGRQDAPTEHAPVVRTGGSTMTTPKSGVSLAKKNPFSMVTSMETPPGRAIGQTPDVVAASIVNGTVSTSLKKASVFERLADPSQSLYRKQNSVRK